MRSVRPPNSESSLLSRYLRQAFSIDLRSLAALRIALGAALLFDLATRARFLEVLYTDQGVLPATGAGLPWTSVHAWSGGVGFLSVLFALHAAAAVCFLIGWRTRLANVVCWLLV